MSEHIDQRILYTILYGVITPIYIIYKDARYIIWWSWEKWYGDVDYEDTLNFKHKKLEYTEEAFEASVIRVHPWWRRRDYCR